MQGLAFVSPPWAGADLWEGASSLEQLPAVLRVTDPDIPKVLVFHDITALWGHEGETWEQGQQEPHRCASHSYSTLLT